MLLALAAALLAPGAAPAQTQPLSLDQVLSMLRADVEAGTILSIASRACIRFRVSRAVESRLRSVGATAGLIDGLRRVCSTASDGPESEAATGSQGDVTTGPQGSSPPARRWHGYVDLGYGFGFTSFTFRADGADLDSGDSGLHGPRAAVAVNPGGRIGVRLRGGLAIAERGDSVVVRRPELGLDLLAGAVRPPGSLVVGVNWVFDEGRSHPHLVLGLVALLSRWPVAIDISYASSYPKFWETWPVTDGASDPEPPESLGMIRAVVSVTLPF